MRLKVYTVVGPWIWTDLWWQRAMFLRFSCKVWYCSPNFYQRIGANTRYSTKCMWNRKKNWFKTKTIHKRVLHNAWQSKHRTNILHYSNADRTITKWPPLQLRTLYWEFSRSVVYSLGFEIRRQQVSNVVPFAELRST